jgi:hypothetical protein
MPRDFSGYRAKRAVPSRLSPVSAQQQVGRAGTSMVRLGWCNRENMPPQLRFFQPPRNRALEHSRPAWAESPTGDDEYTAPSSIARCRDKGGEFPMRLGLGQSVQIEACFDLVQTALQPLGICAVDPGKTVECRGGVPRTRMVSLSSGRFGLRHLGWHRQHRRVATAQGPRIANDFLPYGAITPRSRCLARRLRHFSSPDCLRRELYGDAGARAHRVRCAARCPQSATDR